MNAKRPLPWDKEPLRDQRRNIVTQLANKDHEFYRDAEDFDPPLSHTEARELLMEAYEMYSEIRALARDLKIIRPLIEGMSGRARRSVEYQSLKTLSEGLTARLRHLEAEATKVLPLTHAVPDTGYRFLEAGTGLTLELIENVPDQTIDEIFPSLLAKYPAVG